MSADSLTIIFHVGRPKTATTYLQKLLSNARNVLFLGKDYPNGLFVDDTLQKLHYEIFKTYRSEIYHNHPHPSRSFWRLIEQYTDLILSYWVKAKNSGKYYRTIVISDECIGDYTNFFGELNIAIVNIIGNRLSTKLKKYFATEEAPHQFRNNHDTSSMVEKVLTVTFREQISWMSSSFSDSKYLTNLRGLLTTEFGKQDSALIGGLSYFDCYRTYREMMSPDWTINFVPYELIRSDPKKYFSDAFPTVFAQEHIDPRLFEEKVNENQVDGINMKKCSFWLTRLIFKIHISSLAKAKALSSKRISSLFEVGTPTRGSWYFYASIFVAGGMLLNLLTRIEGRVWLSRPFCIADDLKKMFANKFEKQNTMLQSVIPRYNLRAMKYELAESGLIEVEID
jgi:hypothetical protein